MIDGDRFIAALQGQGIDYVTGVPCSFLTPLMNAAISRSDLDYVGATSEGEAVALAAGAWLGGRMGVAMMQNSGLGNAVNPLTSLCHTLDIPCLLIVTWRGAPDLHDEPQHADMGRLTEPLLSLLGIPCLPFPESEADVPGFVAAAASRMREARRPVATILPKGRIRPAPLSQAPVTAPPRPEVRGGFTNPEAPPRRVEMMARVLAHLPAETGIVATTGYCARELYATDDRERNLYVVGSMGGASAIGLGAAQASGRPIAVFDGDGAMLMKLGNLATIGAEAPGAFLHVLFDNGMHESTGGQATVAPGVDFAAVAVAAGYRAAWRADSLETLDAALAALVGAEGPCFLHLRVSPSRIENLPRPKITPPDVAARFRGFLTRTPRP
jgi:phosphonopyruvate decarboxylase